MNHCHHAHEQVVDYSRYFFIAIAVNLGFTVLEAVIASIAHSSSLMADAAHNLGDVLGLAMACLANWLSQQRPNANYSYGYKRTTILSALLNALLLILTSGWIAFHAVHRLIHPAEVLEGYIMIAAAVGIVVNGGTALLFMRGGSDLNIKGAFLHLSYDALISLGVVVSGAVIYLTHWWWVDPGVGLLIVAVMLMGAGALFRRSFGMMMDAVPHPIDIDQVQAVLAAWPGVKEVHDLHVWALSTQETALTAHLYLPNRPGLSREEYSEINCVLKKRFQITHVTLQVEQEPLGDEQGKIQCGC